MYVAPGLPSKIISFYVLFNVLHVSLFHWIHILLQEQDLKISELESENRKMKVELEEFRTESMHLKNQQATIRRLEERNRQLEQQVSSAWFANKCIFSNAVLCFYVL